MSTFIDSISDLATTRADGREDLWSQHQTFENALEQSGLTVETADAKYGTLTAKEVLDLLQADLRSSANEYNATHPATDDQRDALGFWVEKALRHEDPLARMTGETYFQMYILPDPTTRKRFPMTSQDYKDAREGLHLAMHITADEDTGPTATSAAPAGPVPDAPSTADVIAAAEGTTSEKPF